MTIIILKITELLHLQLERSPEILFLFYVICCSFLETPHRTRDTRNGQAAFPHATDSVNIFPSPLLLFSFLCAAISVLYLLMHSDFNLLLFLSAFCFWLLLRFQNCLYFFIFSLSYVICLLQLDILSTFHSSSPCLLYHLHVPRHFKCGKSLFFQFVTLLLLLPTVCCCRLLLPAPVPAHFTCLGVVNPECSARGPGPEVRCAFAFMTWTVCCFMT